MNHTLCILRIDTERVKVVSDCPAFAISQHRNRVISRKFNELDSITRANVQIE